MQDLGHHAKHHAHYTAQLAIHSQLGAAAAILIERAFTWFGWDEALTFISPVFEAFFIIVVLTLVTLGFDQLRRLREHARHGEHQHVR